MDSICLPFYDETSADVVFKTYDRACIKAE